MDKEFMQRLSAAVIPGTARRCSAPGDPPQVAINMHGGGHMILCEGQKGFAEVARGDYGPVAAYVEEALSKENLVQIAKGMRERHIASGTLVNIGNERAPLLVWARTDTEGASRLADAIELMRDTGEKSVPWASQAGTVQVNFAQLKQIQTAVRRHGQSCYSVYGAVCDAIASGKITKASEVESADWPQ